MNHFRIIPFICGICAAVIAYMLYKPGKVVIKQYPHPNDSDGKIFRDPNGVCYKYSSHEVNCDANEATLKEYPVQG